MMVAVYTEEEQDSWRACVDHLRSEIKERAVERRPHKLLTRKGEYEQYLLWRERCQIRALYLLYGLLRGKTWQQIESTHEEPVIHMRPYLGWAWKSCPHTAPPAQIADWLS